MKTVSYKDRYGAIVIDTYLDYIESYEEGNVPKQMIDVNGTLVDSDKLYEIIYKAETRATVREAIKEQELVDERIKYAPWYFKPWALWTFFILGFLIVGSLGFWPEILNKDDPPDMFIFIIIAWAVFLGTMVTYVISRERYGITDKHRATINHYEAERRKRFNRKKRWR